MNTATNAMPMMNFDGDGYDDPVVAAVDWHNENGALYGFSGVALSTGSIVDNDNNDLRVTGSSWSDQAGNAVANLGDFDGDGLDDLVVSAPGCANDSESGSAYTMSASRLGTHTNTGSLNLVLRGSRRVTTQVPQWLPRAIWTRTDGPTCWSRASPDFKSNGTRRSSVATRSHMKQVFTRMAC